MYARALAIYERRGKGPDDEGVGMALNNLGMVCKSMGEQQQAITYYERAVSIWKLKYGARHRESHHALGNYSDIHLTLGHVAEAERLYRESLDMRRATLGDKHPDVAESLMNLDAYGEQHALTKQRN